MSDDDRDRLAPIEFGDRLFVITRVAGQNWARQAYGKKPAANNPNDIFFHAEFLHPESERLSSSPNDP
jgi:hypothetical protein